MHAMFRDPQKSWSTHIKGTFFYAVKVFMCFTCIDELTTRYTVSQEVR